MMLGLLQGMMSDMEETVELISKFKFPNFQRDTEYVGLVSDDGEYPLLSGDIGSTDGIRLSKNDYKKNYQ